MPKGNCSPAPTWTTPCRGRITRPRSKSSINPLGVKGCGEAGCAGGLASVMNAVVDALSVYGIRHIDMPATPERVWQAIRAAAGKSSAASA
jgi:carbon-monoxide dehydrogenase large subunit